MARLGVAFGLLLGLMGPLAGACANRSPWMSFAEYGQIDHAVPYVLRWATPSASLVYFGSAHTFDPADPQVARIEALWSSMRPTIAFNEGGDPPALASVTDAVSRHGEAGLVRSLAARDHVPVRSLEPSFERQVEALRRSFTSEQIKVFYVARQMAQHQRQGSDESDLDHLDRVLGFFSAVPGLEGAPDNRDELQSACRRLLSPAATCLDPPQEWFDPARFDTGIYTNALGRALSQFRDEDMVIRLAEAMQPGARVFAVVGASHVVMQQKALERAIGARPALLP